MTPKAAIKQYLRERGWVRSSFAPTDTNPLSIRHIDFYFNSQKDRYVIDVQADYIEIATYDKVNGKTTQTGSQLVEFADPKFFDIIDRL